MNEQFEHMRMDDDVGPPAQPSEPLSPLAMDDYSWLVMNPLELL